MDYEIVELPEMRIVGVRDRIASTTGECSLKIPNLWRALLGAPQGSDPAPEGKMHRIAHRKEEPYETVAVYANYDYAAWEYDAIIGCEVDAAADAEAAGDAAAPLPEGLVAFTIPAGRYARFDVTDDTMSAAWDVIYGPDFPRGDVADFEAYTRNADGSRTCTLFSSVRA